jgi:hypothetical protein
MSVFARAQFGMRAPFIDLRVYEVRKIFPTIGRRFARMASFAGHHNPGVDNLRGFHLHHLRINRPSEHRRSTEILPNR